MVWFMEIWIRRILKSSPHDKSYVKEGNTVEDAMEEMHKGSRRVGRPDRTEGSSQFMMKTFNGLSRFCKIQAYNMEKG